MQEIIHCAYLNLYTDSCQYTLYKNTKESHQRHSIYNALHCLSFAQFNNFLKLMIPYLKCCFTHFPKTAGLCWLNNTWENKALSRTMLVCDAGLRKQCFPWVKICHIVEGCVHGPTWNSICNGQIYTAWFYIWYYMVKHPYYFLTCIILKMRLDEINRYFWPWNKWINYVF